MGARRACGGQFSIAQLDRYRRMLAACHEAGLAAVVTMRHFTSPRFVAARGGWEVGETARLFARYHERAEDHLVDLINTACTIDEINLPVVLQQASFLHNDDAILQAPWRTAAARVGGRGEAVFEFSVLHARPFARSFGR